jgi:hypothetical protein
MAERVPHLILRISNDNCSEAVQRQSTFPVNLDRGLASSAKFLIHLRVIPTVPKKARTPVRSVGVGH